MQKNVDKTAGVFQIQVPIRCAECGGQMIRKFDCRRKHKTKWICKNPACKKETFISDDETLARLTKIINGMISNPDTVGDEQEKEKTSVNEFNYADMDAVVKNISKLYSVIDEKAAMTERVKVLRRELVTAKEETEGVDKFLRIVRKYTEISELTPETVREFIDRIIIHEAEKTDGKKRQIVEIYYNCVGVIPNPA